jgi:hypothetical protein
MAQADSVHSTPPEPAPYNPYSSLESLICDLALMAGVNSTIVESNNLPRSSQINKGFTLVSDAALEELLFSAYHLEQIVAFKKQYYAGSRKAVALAAEYFDEPTVEHERNLR